MRAGRRRGLGLRHVGAQVVGRLGEASNPKVRAKLHQLLQAAVQGVLANDSVSPSDLLLFIHGVLEAGIAAEEAAQTAVQAAAEAPGAAPVVCLPKIICSWCRLRVARQGAQDGRTSSDIWCEFGWNPLHQHRHHHCACMVQTL